jgi:hypothetical protein
MPISDLLMLSLSSPLLFTLLDGAGGDQQLFLA